jgi:hypothetical protein
VGEFIILFEIDIAKYWMSYITINIQRQVLYKDTQIASLKATVRKKTGMTVGH